MSDANTRAARLLHHRGQGLAKGDPYPPPLVSAATYHLPETEGARNFYGRNSMPTWEELEAQLSILEDAPSLAFPSGMAAISAALMATLRAGDRLILPADGYYVSRVFARDFLAPLGVEVSEVPTRAYATADFTGARAVLVETPSNPGLDLVDIRATAARAHAAGALVIADNTTMTPYLQRPLDLGADLVVAADTKAPAGHADLLAGHVATRDAALLARLRDWRRQSGAVPGAFEAWLLMRGLETLELRLSRMCATAQVLAERLDAHPATRAVCYPGLPSHPDHALARAQMANGGFLIGFELQGATAAEGFLARCPFIAQTTSFGATHTSGERRIRWGDGVAEGFIRLSVGIEPVEVLWSAIDAALQA